MPEDLEKRLVTIGKVLVGKLLTFRCDHCDKSYDFAISIENGNGVFGVEHPNTPICHVCFYKVKIEETFLKGWVDAFGATNKKDKIDQFVKEVKIVIPPKEKNPFANKVVKIDFKKQNSDLMDFGDDDAARGPRPEIKHNEVVGYGEGGLVIAKYDPASIAIGDRLDEYSANLVLNEGKCPVCHSKLVKGPKGGLSVNVKCDGCGRGYNASPLLVERIF